jgi:hypothetical protein
MAVLAPFILKRTFDELDASKAFKRKILANQPRSALFVARRLIVLWVSVARVNYLLFQDFVDVLEDLYKLSHYIAQERESFLELGQMIPGYEKATPNYYVGLHMVEQIYLCTPI